MASRMVDVLALTRSEVAMLYQAAHIKELRTRSQGSDNALYALLHTITRFVHDDPSGIGSATGNPAEADEPEWWGTTQIAKAAKVSSRTVTTDCKSGDLPAARNGRNWIVAKREALTYIARRRRN